MKNKPRKNWQIIGYLPTDETVYCSSEGEHAKEIDHQYLAEMTAEELRSVLPEREHSGNI